MNIIYKTGFDEEWIDQIIELHNKTELMKRGYEYKEKFLRAYKNRYAVVTCWKEDRLIGFGTLISDGEMYSSIFDLVIDPAFQKKGIGRQIIDRLTKTAPDTCIHLTSTFGNEKFYEKVGFKKHKTAYAKYPWESEYLE